MIKKPKLVTIVGPTAAGKTSLSLALARQFSGEIISADSRQVYRGMDIGTGKVTKEEMGDIPHHLLDVADPMTVFTGDDFVKQATMAIENILVREHVPIIAGGSFFYVQLLRGRIHAAPVAPDEAFRAKLAPFSDAELFVQLQAKDSVRASTIDPSNRRRLIRALEIINALGVVPPPSPIESTFDWLLIGVDLSKEQLHYNIHRRLHERLTSGMIEEVERLHSEGVTFERMDELGLEYRYIAKYLQGELTKADMTEQLETKIRQYAKRQMTWLKRIPEIAWYAPDNHVQIFEHVERFLHE